MKKMVALMLSGMMALSVPALAETAEATAKPAALEAEATQLTERPEAPYEGEWITISAEAGASMELCLPTGWQAEELTDDDVAAGLLYRAVAEEGEQEFAVSHEQSDEAIGADAIREALAEDYADAAVIRVNGTDCVKYTDSESDAIVLVVPDETGRSVFTFTPASDEAFASLAEQMIDTIAVNPADGGADEAEDAEVQSGDDE